MRPSLKLALALAVFLCACGPEKPVETHGDASDSAGGDAGVSRDAARPLFDGSTGDAQVAPQTDAGGLAQDASSSPGADAAPTPGQDAAEPLGQDAAQPPSLDASQPLGPDSGATGPIVDLRADNNRNGTVDLYDPTEDLNEDTWDSTHGAIFLANIDDDQNVCPKTGSDTSALTTCNDANDNVVNGPDDLLDLARLKTVPWSGAPADAQGTLSVSAAAASHVRFFISQPSGFVLFTPTTDHLTATQIQAGVELAIEGKDVVRNSTTWDGYVDVTFTVTGSGMSATSDTVRMREAPLIVRHHLDPPKRVYASASGTYSDPAFASDLSAALTAAAVPNPLYDVGVSQYLTDPWVQDHFETAYMAMPAVGGMHVIDVNIRSANKNRGSGPDPLRTPGKIVFSMLRGKDVAGVQQYDPTFNSNDTLNSFGNLETIPPYSYNGKTYPLGRIFRGNIASFHPDTTMLTLLESQKVQPPLYVDTSFLLVGHVDETISFVRAPALARGWTIAVADPALAKTLLQAQVTAGKGNTLIFAGQVDAYGYSAERTISDLLTDTDVLTTSNSAAASIAAQIAVLKQETGIVDSEILRLPVLFWTVSNYAVAYTPGLVNGISLGDAHFGPPRPHGPVVNGRDIFEVQAETEFAKVGITVNWIEDWDLYHVSDGEVHCGSNTTRQVPATERWWESGL